MPTSAREILLQCIALSERLDAPKAESTETTPSTEQLRADLLNSVASWYWSSKPAFAAIEDGHAYARRELYRDSAGEIVAMHWAPGRVTAPHDHAGARGLVFLLDQEFTERHFEFTTQHSPTAHWASSSAYHLQSPQIVRVSNATVHDMCCTGNGTSVHVYFPAVVGMRVLDIAARTIWHVTADTGAWLPDHPSQVIRSEHW
jgi:predicted metal-dependent enzyme (double-stranded beta helix superfamily)